MNKKDAAGSGKEELLLEAENRIFADDWPLDGRSILYEVWTSQTHYDL